MKKTTQQTFLKLAVLYLLLQPFFDILSSLAIKGVIINISTFVKPIFVFTMALILFFKCNKQKKMWFLYAFMFLIFMLGHFYILKNNLLLSNKILFQEFRFVSNIIYMIMFYLYLKTLYDNYDDKEEMIKRLKDTLFKTFMLYFFLLLLAVLTNTSFLTYEYADAKKEGFKGWFDSGQILGHSYSILFPFLLYEILKPKRNFILKIVLMIMVILSISLIGTKVPYYITFIVLVLYIILTFIIKYINKEFKKNHFNICLVILCLLSMIFTYKYTPIKHNTNLNVMASSVVIDEYTINFLKDEPVINKIVDKKVYNKKYVEYNKWKKTALEVLDASYLNGSVHPSNVRLKWIVFNRALFKNATLEYKIFGIGFLNETGNQAIESDFLMALYNFGILGFILFLIIPLWIFIKSTIWILRNLKYADLEVYMLYMGLGIFFSISIYAGYTYIYTNFNVFLVVLLVLLSGKIKLIESRKPKKNVSSITMLLLHLGYGGIESASINTCNALVKNYEVNIISFYNLKKNQSKLLNKNIKVKYLCKGEPNREEFMEAFSSRNIKNILKEGIKSIDILLKKKIFIIINIMLCKSDVIVSTRMEFSTLLSKYGKKNKVNVAQEHLYHNGNKKYLKTIKNKYNKIDYLCALTKTLKSDYEKVLKNNNHTKVIMLPNMVNYYPDKVSNLDNNLITIARLVSGKKIDEMLTIFSKIKNKDVKLFIIGDGKELNNLKKLSKAFNIDDKVIFTGFLNQEQIKEYLLKSRIFLMTSLTEGLPMVLLESMSYGVPVIAYETASGVNDIVDNNLNGYVIKNRNEIEYLEKLEELISDEKKNKEFSKNAIIKSKKYSEEEVMILWNQILKERV